MAPLPDFLAWLPELSNAAWAASGAAAAKSLDYVQKRSDSKNTTYLNLLQAHHASLTAEHKQLLDGYKEQVDLLRNQVQTLGQSVQDLREQLTVAQKDLSDERATVRRLESEVHSIRGHKRRSSDQTDAHEDA